MNNKNKMPSLDTTSTDPYAELKEQRPDLFEPIPLTIGHTNEHPEGFPNGVVEGWREIGAPHFNEVIDNGEPLVNIANLTPPIFTTGDYSAKLAQSGYETPLDGSTIAQYVRSDVARKLGEAQKLLPNNYRLVMFDAWRSLDTQYATYEMCYQSLVDKLVEQGVLAEGEPLTEKTAEIISKETQKFISLPSPLPPEMAQAESEAARARQIPSPHNTGGSVDLSIAKIDNDWIERLEQLEAIASAESSPFSLQKALANFEIAKLYRDHAEGLDFGTAFDFAGQQSALTFCETDDSLGQTAKDNRRMLYSVMTQAGFEPYAEEWWHFNSGNQMAAMTRYRRTGEKLPATYGNALISSEQQTHERVHGELLQLLKSFEGKTITNQDIPESLRSYGATQEIVQHLVDLTGDLRESKGFMQTWDMKYRGDLAPEFVSSVSQAQDA